MQQKKERGLEGNTQPIVGEHSLHCHTLMSTATRFHARFPKFNNILMYITELIFVRIIM